MAEDKMVSGNLVRKIARQYAVEHGWCDEVDRALEKMGLEPACGDPVSIRVDILIPLKVEVEVNEIEWDEMSDAERIEMLGSHLQVGMEGDVTVEDGPVTVNRSRFGKVADSIRIIGKGALIDDPTEGRHLRLFEGGRVRHWVRNEGDAYDTRWVALCGQESTLPLSSDFTANTCARCQRIVDRANNS